MRVFEEKFTTKRNGETLATVVESDNFNGKIVLFAHGFRADKTEGDRFLTVAKALAEDGVNSIMASFAGCGDSKEPFENYCMSNCIADVDMIYQYMKDHYDVDEKHVGMIGYSMGGRLTSIYSAIHPEIQTIGEWAAANYYGFDGSDFFLDERNNIKKMMEEAKEKGYALAINDFDAELSYNNSESNYIHLSLQFFNDMYDYDPYKSVCNYKGNIIMVHGNNDDMVPFNVSERAYAGLTTEKNKKFVVVQGANHGMGLWDNHMEQSEKMTSETIKFFKENL